ncbi:MAG TPA: complex I subunit 1 family protein [Tepidisphaeraceae bacterium]|nr:complex I subunit 1 family protein [Tepidisphaeraceae bacterium]
MEAPTLMQRVLFHGEPGLLAGLAWDIALILLVFLPFISVFAMMAIWGERKVAGRMQCRPGPNRVGPAGLLQSVADGVKLILKEDLRPACADAVLFRLAPYLAFVPVFAAFLALPFSQDFTFEPRISSGLFWLLAILSLEIMGVILAGWASNNKWSIYGAMREACQMVSYEIPLGISIIVAVMTAGTLNMVEMGVKQGGGLHTWLICRNPFGFVAFFVYFVASLASNKRAPFDLPESESELVAGFHTEYSGLRFSMFFFAEYAAMFIVGAIQVATFLGGWNDPFGLIGVTQRIKELRLGRLCQVLEIELLVLEGIVLPERFTIVIHVRVNGPQHRGQFLCLLTQELAPVPLHPRHVVAFEPHPHIQPAGKRAPRSLALLQILRPFRLPHAVAPLARGRTVAGDRDPGQAALQRRRGILNRFTAGMATQRRVAVTLVQNRLAHRGRNT